MAEYWKVTHRHRPYNIIPVAFYVTLEGKIPRTPLSFEKNALGLKYTTQDKRRKNAVL